MNDWIAVDMIVERALSSFYGSILTQFDLNVRDQDQSACHSHTCSAYLGGSYSTVIPKYTIREL